MRALIRRLAESLRSLRLVDNRELHLLHEQIHLHRLFGFLKIDCVFDIGANSGQYASMIRRKAGFGGRIISFEPIPQEADRIRQLAARDPSWTLEELAVAGESGARDFNIMGSSRFSSLAHPRHDEVEIFRDCNRVKETISVRTETLSSVFNRLRQKFAFHRPFLKMDTQGFDVEVVRSGSEVIQQFLGLQSELAVKKIYDQSVDFREAISFYQSCGFELSAMVPNNGGHFPGLIELDCIMIRRDLFDESFRKLSR